MFPGALESRKEGCACCISDLNLSGRRNSMRWNSLVSRMTVFSVGIVLAATLVGAVSSYLQAKSVLEDVHRRQVKVLMTSMEATAGDPLIYSNYAVLVHFVTVLAEKEPFVAFAAG